MSPSWSQREGLGESLRGLLLAGAVRLDPHLSAGGAGLSVSGAAYAGEVVGHAHGSFAGAGWGRVRLHDLGDVHDHAA